MLNTLLTPHTLPAVGVPRRSYAQRTLAAGAQTELVNIQGPGCIQHIFFTMPPHNMRDFVLRAYWDDEESPSVECPVPEFFGVGHNLDTAAINNMLFYVAPRYGFNCYIPMPFATRARLTLTNESDRDLPGIFCYVSFTRYHEPLSVPWRLHMAWRREMPAYRRGAPFVMAEAKGEGRLLAVIFHLCRRDSDDRWTHGGAEQILIDGDTAEPSLIYGVGGEDFAHQAWGLYPSSGLFAGAHFVHPVPDTKPREGNTPFEPHGWEQHDGGRYSMYRFFVPDVMPFRQSLRLTFGSNANEISTTTYWYQSEPHSTFTTLPSNPQRHFGSRLAKKDCYHPIPFAGDIPVATLGPVMLDETPPWTADKAVDLSARYPTNVTQPFADVVKPPFEIRWRRSTVRAGFIDLAAIHRPKCQLAVRGLWHDRNLPTDIVSFQLIRLHMPTARQLTLRIGFEDRVTVWSNGVEVANQYHPEPQCWEIEDVPLALSEGVNDIVLAASQERECRWTAWVLYMAFLDENEELVRELPFGSFDELDKTAEEWLEPWPPDEPVDTGARDPLHLR